MHNLKKFDAPRLTGTNSPPPPQPTGKSRGGVEDFEALGWVEGAAPPTRYCFPLPRCGGLGPEVPGRYSGHGRYVIQLAGGGGWGVVKIVTTWQFKMWVWDAWAVVIRRISRGRLLRPRGGKECLSGIYIAASTQTHKTMLHAWAQLGTHRAYIP